MSARYQAVCDCGFERTYSARSHAERALAEHSCRTGHCRSCRRCGWSITSRTARLADRAKRQHSCAFQLTKAVSRLRGQLRRASIDRTPRPCRHKRANHQHGTGACYTLDGCRCWPCTRARARVDDTRRRAQAYGRYDRYVDAQPCRDHIAALEAAGMGLKRIVAVSDLSQGMLWKLMYGKRRPDGSQTPTRRVLRTTADRVLAVELDLAGGAFVDTWASTRRIQALVASGWSMAKLAARLEIHPGNFTALAHGTRGVTVATATAVHALYRELVDTPPPETNHRERQAASRARNYARAHDWAPPLRIGGRAWIGAALELPDDDIGVAVPEELIGDAHEHRQPDDDDDDEMDLEDFIALLSGRDDMSGQGAAVGA